MCDLDNEPLVKMVGVEHVQTVVSHDIIGRLMIQCARQHGLASVWQNIMGFEGAVLVIEAQIRNSRLSQFHRKGSESILMVQTACCVVSKASLQAGGPCNDCNP